MVHQNRQILGNISGLSVETVFKFGVILLLSLVMILQLRERIFVFFIMGIIILINAFLGFFTARFQGINLEIFGFGTSFFLVFFGGKLGFFFLFLLMISYFTIGTFNFWSVPYILGNSIAYLFFSLITPGPSLLYLGLIIVFVNLVTYLFFAFFHGNLMRPVKDIVISLFLNLLLLQLFGPILLALI